MSWVLIFVITVAVSFLLVLVVGMIIDYTEKKRTAKAPAEEKVKEEAPAVAEPIRIDLKTEAQVRDPLNVDHRYDYWVRHVNHLLNRYDDYDKYKKFKQTVAEVLKQSKGKVFSKESYMFLKFLLTLCQLIIHNRLRRRKPVQYLTNENVDTRKLAFTITYENEKNPYVVEERSLYGRISELLDRFRSEEGIKLFEETRQVISVYAVNSVYTSVNVFSDVLNILHYFQHAIEDAYERERMDQEEEAAAHEWVSQAITTSLLGEYDEPWGDRTPKAEVAQ